MIDISSSAIRRAILPVRMKSLSLPETAANWSQRWLLYGLFLVLIFPLAAPAAEVRGLYETEVVVTSQGRDERHAAIRVALDEVLVRISGDRNTPRLAALQGLYKRSSQLVQQYRYRTLPRVEGASGDQAGGLGQVLWVSFDAAAIEQALRRAGVPLWGQVRPATLVWVVVDDGGVRSLMGADTLPQLKKVMQQQAQRRGIPLFVPLWDLEDQMALRFSDVWGNFQDAIMKASARYATEAILVGRLYRQRGGIWKSRWTLYQGDESVHWQASSPRQAEVLSAGVDGVADHLGQRFAKVFDESQSGRVNVIINDVTTLEDYARSAQFLQSLDVVTAMQVVTVAASSVTFELQIRGDSEGLAQIISFGRTLLEIPAVVNADHREPLLPSRAMPGEAYDQLWFRLLP